MRSSGPRLFSCLPCASVRRFKVEGLVAKGERSVVRRAAVTGSNDKIVIKILPSICDEKGTVLPREVLAMRMCEHPCVLSVKKVFYDVSQTFICMMLWSGGNVLDRILETGGIAEEDAVLVVQDVLDGLDHIHSRGLIHSAIEPFPVSVMRRALCYRGRFLQCVCASTPACSRSKRSFTT